MAENLRSLEQIRSDVIEVARGIGASSPQLPRFGFGSDDGRSHIEVEASTYHYVFTERGRELQRRTTLSYPDLLYWIFSDITYSLACEYELCHRTEGKDCRRMIFPHQVHLMSMVNPDYRQQAEQKIEAILRVSPYDDKPTRDLDRLLEQQSKRR